MSEEQVSPQQALVRQVRGPQFLEQVKAALPESVPPSRFVRVLVSALMENPELAEAADHPSILRASVRAAVDGLMPDGREAALVVYKRQAQYQPMVGGYRKIAAECGWALEARAVHAADEFRYELGLEPVLVHVPATGDRGELTHVYAVGRELHGPGRMVDVMTKAEVDRIRATSRSKDRGPWVEWYDRMAEKTVARRLFKSLPLGERERVRSVLHADELAPGEAADLAYGSHRELPAGTPAGGSGGAAGSSPPPGDPVPENPQAAVAPFTGEEPPEPEPQPEPEQPAPKPPTKAAIKAAGAVVLPEAFTRHAGETLAAVAKADPEYLAWLGTEAVADTELRAAAQLVAGGAS